MQYDIVVSLKCCQSQRPHLLWTDTRRGGGSSGHQIAPLAVSHRENCYDHERRALGSRDIHIGGWPPNSWMERQQIDRETFCNKSAS